MTPLCTRHDHNPRVDSLTFIGHATASLRLDGAAVVTDPYLRGWLGPLRRRGAAPADLERLDAILISHLHRDHLDFRSLSRLPGDAPIVVPRGAAGIGGRSGREVIEVAEGDSVEIGPLTIAGVPAVHGGKRDPWAAKLIDPLGFVIRSRERSVYFAGDTDLYDAMDRIGPVDLALVPVWGWGPTVGEGHLDPARAAEALRLVQPRVAVPIHWGTFYPVGLARLKPGPLNDPPHEFARLASRAAPGVRVQVLQPGSTMPLTP